MTGTSLEVLPVEGPQGGASKPALTLNGTCTMLLTNLLHVYRVYSKWVEGMSLRRCKLHVAKTEF